LEEIKQTCDCNKEQITIINIVIENITTDYLQKSLDFKELKIIKINYDSSINQFATGVPT
jgi:hypothetical protein